MTDLRGVIFAAEYGSSHGLDKVLSFDMCLRSYAPFESEGVRWGPPCIIAELTSTPVGKPLHSRRPAFSSKIGKSN